MHDIERCEKTTDTMMSSYGATSSIAQFAAQFRFFSTPEEETTGVDQVKGAVASVKKKDTDAETTTSCSFVKKWVMVSIAAFVIFALGLGLTWIMWDSSHDDGSLLTSSTASTSGDLNFEKDHGISKVGSDHGISKAAIVEASKDVEPSRHPSDDSTNEGREETTKDEKMSEESKTEQVWKTAACACAGTFATIGCFATQLWQ